MSYKTEDKKRPVKCQDFEQPQICKYENKKGLKDVLMIVDQFSVVQNHL